MVAVPPFRTAIPPRPGTTPRMVTGATGTSSAARGAPSPCPQAADDVVVRDRRRGDDTPHPGGHLNDLDLGSTQEWWVAAGVECESADAIGLPITVADPDASPRVPVAA